MGTPNFLAAKVPTHSTARDSAKKRRAPAGAPSTCREAAALRCDVCSSRTIPHEGGDKAQWQKRLLRAGRKRAARSGRLPTARNGGAVRPRFCLYTDNSATTQLPITQEPHNRAATRIAGCRGPSAVGRCDAGSHRRSLHLFPVPHPDPLNRIELLQPVDDVHAVDDVAEDRVLRVEVRLR